MQLLKIPNQKDSIIIDLEEEYLAFKSMLGNQFTGDIDILFILITNTILPLVFNHTNNLDLLASIKEIKWKQVMQAYPVIITICQKVSLLIYQKLSTSILDNIYNNQQYIGIYENRYNLPTYSFDSIHKYYFRIKAQSIKLNPFSHI